MKIVSLLPSATEIICRLGLRNQLVGVSHECDYPTSVIDLPRVTRSLIPSEATSRFIDGQVRERLTTEHALYTLELQLLEELNPDLIVTQTLCNVCAVAEEEVRAATRSLSGFPRVVNLEPTCLDDVFESVRLVGEATDRAHHAEQEIASLQKRVHAVAERSSGIACVPRVVVLEWVDPPFSSGHWSPELVALAGGKEMIGIDGQPSRTARWQEVVNVEPEVLLVACCGYVIERTLEDLPILRAYPGWDMLPCVQNSRVYIVDGSAYFSRPGPRLVDSLEILAHALHPKIHPLPCQFGAARRLSSNELR